MSYLLSSVSGKTVRLPVLLRLPDVDNDCVDLSDPELKLWLDLSDLVGVLDFRWDLLDLSAEGDLECWKDLSALVGDLDLCRGVSNHEGDLDLL